MSNASLSWWPDGWRRVRRTTDGVLHVHVGGVQSLQETLTLKSACDENAMCMSRALMMVHVSIVLGPVMSLHPLVQRFVHSTLHGSLAALGLSTNME